MIKAGTKDAQILMLEGIQALSRASIQGMKINVPYCKKQKIYLTKKIQKLKEEFAKTETGKLWKKYYRTPNFNSDDQLRDILFNKKKLKSVKKTKPSKTYPKGNDSVDKEALTLLAKEEPDIKILAEINRFSPLLNTFINGILKEQVDGILHPTFSLHTTKSFRSSSQNINFQNQPNRDPLQKKIIRSCFIPSKGNQIIAADFTGIEVGISSCVHKDPKMLDYVRHPEKNNMHTDLAIQCYLLDQFEKSGSEKTLRKGAKNGFVFPQFYGDYYGNNVPVLSDWGNLPTKGSYKSKDGLKLMTGLYLGDHLKRKGIRNFNDFKDHIQDVENDFWNKRFKVYKQWKENNVKKYFKKGYLNTLTGFTVQGMMSKNGINNYPIQGPAFHCLLKTFIETDRRIIAKKMKSKLIGQIHDELVFDACPDEKDELLDMVRRVACIWLKKQWPWIIIPLEVEANVFDIDANWAQDSKVIKLAA